MKYECDIILLGQCKNGTTTIRDAVREIVISAGGEARRTGWFGNEVMVGEKHPNRETMEKYKEWVNKYDEPFNIIHDDPVPFYYKEFYNYFGPDAKYILSYRNEDEWFDSFLYAFQALTGKYNIKRHLYPLDDEILYGLEASREQIIKLYLTQNQKITNFFKDKPNFLSLNIDEFKNNSHKENWCTLFDFLGVEYDDEVINKDFLHLRSSFSGGSKERNKR